MNSSEYWNPGSFFGAFFFLGFLTFFPAFPFLTGTSILSGTLFKSILKYKLIACFMKLLHSCCVLWYQNLNKYFELNPLIKGKNFFANFSRCYYIIYIENKIWLP